MRVGLYIDGVDFLYASLLAASEVNGIRRRAQECADRLARPIEAHLYDDDPTKPVESLGIRVEPSHNLPSVYQQGLQSFSGSRGQYVNPYSVNSEEYNDYERGWVQGLKRSSNSEGAFFMSGSLFEDYKEQERIRDVAAAAAERYRRARG